MALMWAARSAKGRVPPRVQRAGIPPRREVTTDGGARRLAHEAGQLHLVGRVRKRATAPFTRHFLAARALSPGVPVGVRVMYVSVDDIAQDLAVVCGQATAEEVRGEPVRLGQLWVGGREDAGEQRFVPL